MDDETRERLESLHKSINLLSENIDFLLKMDNRTLLIVARIGYILERISNKTFDLDEADGEPNISQIEKSFAEIRRLFEQQQAIMRGENPGDA